MSSTKTDVAQPQHHPLLLSFGAGNSPATLTAMARKQLLLSYFRGWGRFPNRRNFCWTGPILATFLQRASTRCSDVGHNFVESNTRMTGWTWLLTIAFLPSEAEETKMTSWIPVGIFLCRIASIAKVKVITHVAVHSPTYDNSLAVITGILHVNHFMVILMTFGFNSTCKEIF